MRTTCSECAKYRGGWCRYKGVDNPAAVKADRRIRLCKPVSRTAEEVPDFGQIAPEYAVRPLSYGRNYKRKK